MDEKWYTDDFESRASASSATPAGFPRRTYSITDTALFKRFRMALFQDPAYLVKPRGKAQPVPPGEVDSCLAVTASVHVHCPSEVRERFPRNVVRRTELLLALADCGDADQNQVDGKEPELFWERRNWLPVLGSGAFAPSQRPPNTVLTGSERVVKSFTNS